MCTLYCLDLVWLLEGFMLKHQLSVHHARLAQLVGSQHLHQAQAAGNHQAHVGCVIYM